MPPCFSSPAAIYFCNLCKSMQKFCRVGVILRNDMQQELLIEKVRQYEFLYNVHSTQYRDQNMRHEAWEEIGRDLKITASQAKDIWSKLRNCFSNALKRRNAKKSGQAAKKYVPWKFEKQMTFLQPYMDSRQTLGNLSQSDNSSQLSEERSQMIEDDIADEPDNAEDGNEIEAGEYSSVSSPCTSNADDIPQARPRSVSSSSTSNADNTSQSRPRYQRPPQRIKRTNPAEEMVAIMKKNSELRMQRADNNKFPNNLNETDMFYLSMSKTIQKLPQSDQIRIRMEMCRLVSEAEMHQLHTPHHNQTLTSPEPTSSHPTSPQPTSPSKIHTQPPVYHTLTPVQPITPFQSQTPAPTQTQISTKETQFNKTNLFYPPSAWL